MKKQLKDLFTKVKARTNYKQRNAVFYAIVKRSWELFHRVPASVLSEITGEDVFLIKKRIEADRIPKGCQVIVSEMAPFEYKDAEKHYEDLQFMKVENIFIKSL